VLAPSQRPRCECLPKATKHSSELTRPCCRSSQTIYSQGVGPVMPGVFMTPFPFWHSMGLSRDTPEDELVKAAVYQLELVLQQQTAPTDTAAIFVEPLLGEGGYIPTPHAYLKALRAICDKHEIMLVIDEVQSGYGRTGKFWCAEHSGVEGDIVVFAKGLANGFPLSGIAASKHVMGSMPPGSLGGTYAGNVVSCAAANAVLDVVRPSSLCVSPAALMLSLSSPSSSSRRTSSATSPPGPTRCSRT
jgi:4-aminobutyrate aminotransferase